MRFVLLERLGHAVLRRDVASADVDGRRRG